MFLRFLERGFVLILILYLMGTFTSIFYGNVDQDAYLSLQGGLHFEIVMVQAAIYGLAVFLILSRLKRWIAAALRAWPIWLMLVLQFCSVAWSIEPTLTLRKSVLEFATLAIGVYLGERYSIAEFADLLMEGFVVAMGAIMVLLVVARKFVLDAEQHNALKGLAQNKNGFGFYIGLTVALAVLSRYERFKWLRYCWLFLATAMLLLSRSGTSVAAAVIILATLPFWSIVRLPGKQFFAANMIVLSFLGFVSFFAATNTEFLLRLLGKDATLTGRTAVWKQLVFAIEHRPWLGYGYGAFWTGLRGESLDVVITSGWIVPSAHNALLELWLSVGVPGILVTVFLLWKYSAMSIRHIRWTAGRMALWPIACVLFILVHGFGESEFIFDSSFACVLFTVLYTSLALEGKPLPAVRFRSSAQVQQASAPRVQVPSLP